MWTVDVVHGYLLPIQIHFQVHSSKTELLASFFLKASYVIFFFESRFKTSTRFNFWRKKVEEGTCFVFKVSWEEVPWLESINYTYHIVGMTYEDNSRCCSIILSTSEMKFRFGSRSTTTSSTSSAAQTLYVRNKKILRCHHCFWAYTDVTCVRIWLRNLTL